MSGFERQVRRAVEGGEFVQYSVTPVYDDANLVPIAVTLSAFGSGGFNLNVSILNGR
jgi:filamentous hemagglutinin